MAERGYCPPLFWRVHALFATVFFGGDAAIRRRAVRTSRTGGFAYTFC